MTVKYGFVRRAGRRARFLPALLMPLLVGAGLASSTASAAQILNESELQARLSTRGFEFRGTASLDSGANLEHHIWRFQPDGTIVDVGSVGHLWYIGGYSEQAIPTTRGTWKLSKNQICIQLQQNDGGLYTPVYRRLDGCYDVLSGPGNHVSLVGPQIFNGTLEPVAAADRPPLATAHPPAVYQTRRSPATTKRQRP